jgi:Protein of unknown function (DUF3225)
MMELNRPEVVAMLRAEFERYETALREHDVRTLNDFFLEHPGSIRYGVSEHCYGHDGVCAYRVAAQPLPLGRKLLRVNVMTFGDECGSVATEFTGPELGKLGRQSQTWLRTEHGWKIAAAHVSVVDPTSLDWFGNARE